MGVNSICTYIFEDALAYAAVIFELHPAVTGCLCDEKVSEQAILTSP